MRSSKSAASARRRITAAGSGPPPRNTESTSNSRSIVARCRTSSTVRDSWFMIELVYLFPGGLRVESENHQRGWNEQRDGDDCDDRQRLRIDGE